MWIEVGQPRIITHAQIIMRPRRWYTDEVAPPRRAVKLNSELWRYRTLSSRRKSPASARTKRDSRARLAPLSA